MKWTLSMLLFAVTLGSCATSKQIKGPNGGTAYVIKCGSAVVSRCYEEASQVCPNGYTFADQQANPNTVVVPAGTGFVGVHGPHTMLIECK